MKVNRLYCLFWLASCHLVQYKTQAFASKLLNKRTTKNSHSSYSSSKQQQQQQQQASNHNNHHRQQTTTATTTTLQNMVDPQILMGGGIALLGLCAGVGLVAFTENQGERAKERGSGLSARMSTTIAGGLLEDVEVDSVDDLGSLTSQLEAALKESAKDKGEVGLAQELEMTLEEKNKIAEQADDGW